MPELPEVETVRRQLAPRLVGRRVVGAGSHPSSKFTPATRLTGTTFTAVRRRGKYLIIPTTDDRELIVHLGMTGKLRFRDGSPDLDDPYLRAWWQLDGEEALEFADVRRFGRLRVVANGDYRDIPTLFHAGPEPWDPELTPKRFHELLGLSRRAVKTQLLSQRPIAGVGNIYADEALWLARINPKVTRIGIERAELLLESLQTVLIQGVDNGGTTLRDYRDVDGDVGSNQHQLLAYGRAGRPCFRCGTPLRGFVLDARTTTYCPRCQRR